MCSQENTNKLESLLKSISKSPSSTAYTAPCHCSAHLLSKQNLSFNCIFSSAPFFQRGLRQLCSYQGIQRIWKTARANYPKNAGDYPIAIHHPWHVTSSVDAAGGQQWLMTAARREIYRRRLLACKVWTEL